MQFLFISLLTLPLEHADMSSDDLQKRIYEIEVPWRWGSKTAGKTWLPDPQAENFLHETLKNI